MSRHSAPPDYRDDEDAARQTHEAMLIEALAHINSLAEGWTSSEEKAYVLDVSTGTLIAIIAS